MEPTIRKAKVSFFGRIAIRNERWTDDAVKFLKALVFPGAISVSLLGSLAARQPPANAIHPTVLIPLNARQIEEILKIWPRIDRASSNLLGIELADYMNRINCPKA